jgi:hypothetical protein
MVRSATLSRIALAVGTVVGAAALGATGAAAQERFRAAITTVAPPTYYYAPAPVYYAPPVYARPAPYGVFAFAFGGDRDRGRWDRDDRGRHRGWDRDDHDHDRGHEHRDRR